MNLRNKSICAAAFLLALGGSVHPAKAETNGPFSAGFNLNIPVATGETSDVLRHGFGFGLHMGYRNESSPIGIRFDNVYDNFSLSSDVLNQINRADSGYATVWGFDLSAVLTPPNAERVRPFLQVGPGFYYEYAQASRFAGS